ncbi:MAG: nucleotide-binding protein [Gemmataceae bacterium]|nr:nucleotide-binding protein [Gemmataceae bacterium]
MSRPPERRPTYNNRVFINCPFDAAYRPLFRALVFTAELCGYSACCALDEDDSSEPRAAKIIRLIEGCRFGIHDISRTESNAEGLPRFNMPYELGLFDGYKRAGSGRQGKKRTLVLDREPYRYQKFLSDIAGQDIRTHANDPAVLIREVRGWFQAQARSRDLPGADPIIYQYDRFRDQVPTLLAAVNKTEADLDSYRDYHNLVYGWLRENTGPKVPAG